MKNERIAINARVSKKTALAFKKIAQEEKRSVSAMVELIMEKEIDNRKS